MNSFLPNGNILATYPVGDETIMSVGIKEIPLSDPDYESYTFFMTSADEARALAALAEYRKAHSKAS